MEEGFRTGTDTDCLEPAIEEGGVSGFSVELPDAAVEVFILVSDRAASFVENIRVRRLVIEGFSAVGTLSCGSEGGAADEAALPFKLRLSRLGMAIPFCDVTGRDSGELTMEEACEVEAEGVLRALSTALSVAMMFVEGNSVC